MDRMVLSVFRPPHRSWPWMLATAESWFYTFGSDGSSSVVKRLQSLRHPVPGLVRFSGGEISVVVVGSVSVRKVLTDKRQRLIVAVIGRASKGKSRKKFLLSIFLLCNFHVVSPLHWTEIRNLV